MTLACFNSASFITTTGLAISVNPTVEVRRESGGLAAIFSDAAGTAPITNPSAFADEVGRFVFYAAGIAGGYKITVTKGAESFVLRNVAIGTAGQYDATTFAGTLLDDATQAEMRATLDVPSASAASRQSLLINPNWLIDQINEGGLYTISGASEVRGPDGWSGNNTNGAGVFKLRTIADPENAAFRCLEITCTTADASIAAGDNYSLYASVEGYEVADMMIGTASAASITLKFKAKFNVTGVYGISIANNALNRSYVGIMTVPDTAENEYTLTLTLDLSGTWLYTNGVGLGLRICLAAGTNWQTTAGAWGANNMFTTSAQANFMSSTSNVGYIKRIQLNPGTVALAYGLQDIQKEMARAQRYYWKTFPQGTAVAQNAGVTGAIGHLVRVAGVFSDSQVVHMPVPMRAIPTTTFYNPSAANANWRNTSDNADSGAGAVQGTASADRVIISCTQVAGDGVSELIQIHMTRDARLS